MALKNLFFTLSILSIISCSNWDGRLILVNKTNHEIRYRDELKKEGDFPPNYTTCATDELYNLPPLSETAILSQNKWNIYFQHHPDEVLRIYIINEDSLKKYGTCFTLKNQIIMKRYDLSYKDIERMNWRIVFDGE